MDNFEGLDGRVIVITGASSGGMENIPIASGNI
jgi:NADP-dependent 3-hydroxy acid dehydrogenase YdfG